MNHPHEPTPEQCSANARLPAFDDRPAFACWYPQMGGYVGKAVVVVGEGGCFDAFVWHDGTFPFNGEYHDGNPARLHHCSPDQFIEFGNAVKRMQEVQA